MKLHKCRHSFCQSNQCRMKKRLSFIAVELLIVCRQWPSTFCWWWKMAYKKGAFELPKKTKGYDAMLVVLYFMLFLFIFIFFVSCSSIIMVFKKKKLLKTSFKRYRAVIHIPYARHGKPLSIYNRPPQKTC